MACSCPLCVLTLASVRKWRPWSPASCVLPRTSQHELQSDLQMAATCTGLGGARRGQAVNQGQLLLVPDLGQLSKGIVTKASQWGSYCLPLNRQNSGDRVQ